MNDHDPIFGSIAVLNPVPNESDLPVGASDPTALLALVDGRDKMLETKEAPNKPAPQRRWKGAWAAAAAFAAVMVLAVVVYAIGPFGDEPPPATTPPPPTTEAPTTSSTTETPTSTTATPAAADPESDVAMFESAVAAWFDNDFETVSELLAIPAVQGSHSDWTPQETQALMEYDALVGARVEDLACTAPNSAGGFFGCQLTYANVLTDAAGWTPEPIELSIRVENGKLARYEFGNEEFSARYDPLHSFGAYVATTGQVPSGYLDCLGESLRFLGRPDAACAQAQLTGLDAWLEWTTTVAATEVVSAYAVAVFSNDCTTYYLLENQLGSDCPTDTTDYEEALGATVEVSNCEPLAVADPEDWNFACPVSYSNALSTAVGAEPASLTAQFYLDPRLKTVTMDDTPGFYPEDRTMLDSFVAFVDGTGLGDSLAEACSINFPERNADCAAFIMQHLADWVAWTASNE